MTNLEIILIAFIYPIYRAGVKNERLRVTKLFIDFLQNVVDEKSVQSLVDGVNDLSDKITIRNRK